jgi:hypothetical protein
MSVNKMEPTAYTSRGFMSVIFDTSFLIEPDTGLVAEPGLSILILIDRAESIGHGA